MLIRKSSVAIAALLSLGAVSQATTFHLDSAQQTMNVNIRYNGPETASAGIMNGSIKTATNTVNPVRVLCYDLRDHVSFGDSYEVVERSTPTFPNMTSNQAKHVAQLVNKYVPSLTSSVSDYVYKSAALQVAIWEIVTDTHTSLISGNFALGTGNSAKVREYADAYLADNNFNNIPTVARWYEATSHSKHGNVYSNQNMVAPVPEPASIAVLSVGIAGLIRKRRNR